MKQEQKKLKALYLLHYYINIAPLGVKNGIQIRLIEDRVIRIHTRSINHNGDVLKESYPQTILKKKAEIRMQYFDCIKGINQNIKRLNSFN